jgi:hypothetical protein
VGAPISEEEVPMTRCWGRGAAALSLSGLLLAGCEGDVGDDGFASVTITDEEEDSLAGDLCAVKGRATNAGNSRAQVRITYEAKDSSGAVIATSTADFEVADFSSFEFRNSVLNSQGQPSSGPFTPSVSCAAIDEIERKDLDVDAI